MIAVIAFGVRGQLPARAATFRCKVTRGKDVVYTNDVDASFEYVI